MAELSARVRASRSTPDRVDALDGHLDGQHPVDVFLAALPATSTPAIRQGFIDVGVEDNRVLIFPELAEPSSRFLTANADTVYYLAVIDLTDGPMVVETPPMAVGTFDDMWFQWIADFGLTGPDRGAGGTYLLVSPGCDTPLPEGGFHVSHSRTNRVLMLGRSFMPDDDPAPTVATIKSTLKIYPHTPALDVPETTFVEGRGLRFDTIPTDAELLATVHARLQDELAHLAAGRVRTCVT